MTGKRQVAAIATASVALILGGCVEFQAQPEVEQVGTKPKVAVTFTICRCEDAAESGTYRLLVGFRVPKGTDAPKSIEPSQIETDGGTGTAATVLGRNRSYIRELNRKAPKPKGFEYVGYSSEAFDVAGEIGFQGTARFKVKLGVPKELVGKRFKVRPVAGIYEVNEDQPEDAPIACGKDPFKDRDGFNCIDDPEKRNEMKDISVKVKES
jgi:hypothetical protein